MARQLYDAWGNIRASAASGTMPTDIGYTGQRLDATGLMYFRARYYSPAVGRFLSADTLVPSASDPQQLNRYAYARGNPVRYTDPTGHYIFEDDPNEGLVYDADRVQRHFGVRVRLRESDESWVRDTGHHPTDAEFVGAMLSGPFMALGAALLPEIGGIPGAIEGLSWKATVACANNPVCATALMGAGAKAAQGSQANRTLLDQLLEKIRGVNPSGGGYNCVRCAIATDATLGGVPTIAENVGPMSIPATAELLQKIYGLGNIFANQTTASKIVEQLAVAGPNARGIVSGISGDLGHAFNAINYQGFVLFIDGQKVKAIETAVFQSLVLYT